MTLDDFLSAGRITNADFASRVSVDTTTISRLRRQLFDPSLDLMRRIAAATDGKVTPNDFLVRPEIAPQPAPAPEAVA